MPRYFMLRDGVHMRAQRAGSGTVFVRKKHGYTVRGVTPEGYYGDSSPVHAFLAT